MGAAFKKTRTAKDATDAGIKERADRDVQMKASLRQRAHDMGESFKNGANEMLEDVDEKPDLGLGAVDEEKHGIGFRLSVGKPKAHGIDRAVIGTVTEKGWRVITVGVNLKRTTVEFGNDDELVRAHDNLLMPLVEEATIAVANRSEDPR